MDTSILLMSRLASMLIMVCLGIIIVRLGVVKAADSKAFSALTVYVLQPALIIYCFELDLTKERKNGFIFALVFCILVYIIWVLITKLLKTPLKWNAIDQATLIYSNAGNLTLPIVAMTLGDEMLFYVSALQIPFNLFIWTHGVMTISGQKSFDIKKLLYNSNIIAMLVGVFILVSGFELPEVIATSLSTLSDAVPSISMIVVGMVIGGKSLRQVFSMKKAYIIALERLVVFPIIIMLMLYATGILTRYPQYVPILQAIFLGLCAPPASTVSQACGFIR